MIELWGRANAYNVQKVLWTLRELGLEFEHYDLGSNAGDLETDEFLALNPHARIPVIRDAAGVVWESNTIVRYLAASYGAGGLWPEDPVARAEADRWMDWELASLQNDFIDLFWSFYRTPVAAREQVRIDAARERCGHRMRQLNDRLERYEFLGGARLTMGDIPCAVCLYRYFEMGLEVERPAAVMRWYATLAQRDAYRRTVMTPFDELAGRIEF